MVSVVLAAQDDCEGGLVVHERLIHVDPFAAVLAVGCAGDWGEVG